MSAVGYERTQLYSALYNAEVDQALTLKVCRIAQQQQTHSLDAWAFMDRAALIYVGLSAAESLVVRRALQKPSDEVNDRAVR